MNPAAFTDVEQVTEVGKRFGSLEIELCCEREVPLPNQ